MADDYVPDIYTYTFDSPWDVNEPRDRLELNAQRALGRILDRRLWWTASSAERDQWMRALDAFLVRLNLSQVLSVWKRRAIEWDYVVPQLLATLQLPMNSTEKHAAIDALVIDVIARIQSREFFVIATRDGDNHKSNGYDDDFSSLYKSEGEWDNDAMLSDTSDVVMGESDSEDELMLDNDDHVVSFEAAVQEARAWLGIDQPTEKTDDNESDSSEEPRRENPFGPIAWVVHVLLLRDKLLRSTAEGKTEMAIQDWLHEGPSVKNHETMECAESVILEVLSSACLPEAVRSVLSIDIPLFALDVLVGQFQAIQLLLEEAKAVVAVAVDCVYTPGPVSLSSVSDTCVTSHLHAALVAQLADLRQQRTQLTSEAGIVHLVDPLVVCSVVGETKTVPPDAVSSYETPAEAAHPVRSLKDKSCHVVVGVTEISLTPEEPTYHGDDWRSEGMDEDRIIVSGVYFYAIENVSNPILTFRTFVSYPFYDSDNDSVTLGLVYGLHERLVQELGEATIYDGRSLVFPNFYLYKLEPFGLSDATKPGKLGMLTLMVVAPDDGRQGGGPPAVTTASAIPEQADRIQYARATALLPLALPDSMQKLVLEYAREGTSIEALKKNRTRFHKERKRDDENVGFMWYHEADISKYFWATGKRP